MSFIAPLNRNPRVNGAAVEAVAHSIREFGLRQPIVVDENGVTIVGHTRFKAAKKLGLETVPVHVATGLAPEQIKPYRLADNKLHELSEWDLDLLPAELAELDAAGYDLHLPGFSDSELAELFDEDLIEGQTDPDAIPEPPEEPISRLGDVWILVGQRLRCGDSTDPDQVKRLLDGARIQLINADPPYNVGVEPRSSNAIAAGIGSFARPSSGRLNSRKNGKRVGFTRRQMRARDRILQNDFVSEDPRERYRNSVNQRTGPCPAELTAAAILSVPVRPREDLPAHDAG